MSLSLVFLTLVQSHVALGPETICFLKIIRLDLDWEISFTRKEEAFKIVATH